MHHGDHGARHAAAAGGKHAGHDPDAFLPLPPPEPDLPSLDDPAALAERVTAMKKESEAKQKELEAKRATMDEEARRTFAAAGMDWDAEKARALRDAAGPPRPLAPGIIASVREAITGARDSAMACRFACLEGWETSTMIPHLFISIIAWRPPR